MTDLLSISGRISNFICHYRPRYGPGTVDIFRENMDMEKLSFDDVNVDKINHLLELESRFNWKGKDKENQISLTDYVWILK